MGEEITRRINGRINGGGWWDGCMEGRIRVHEWMEEGMDG